MDNQTATVIPAHQDDMHHNPQGGTHHLDTRSSASALAPTSKAEKAALTLLGIGATLTTPAQCPSARYLPVPVGRLQLSSEQHRKRFDPVADAELALSIKAHGVLQPLLVRAGPAAGETHETNYEIVAGARRWRASREVGLMNVPVLVLPIEDDTALEVALTENLQRADLSPLNTARALLQIKDMQVYSVRELASHLGYRV